MSTPGTGPQPGELARLTAVHLTAAGLTATIPDPAAPDDPSRLAIDCRAARCALAVSDIADAELHWTPHAGDSAADPHRVAGLAAALLSGPPPVPHPTPAAATAPSRQSSARNCAPPASSTPTTTCST
jgi:hypothetical protein